MNTVIVVNLNGIAYHIEEPGYQALRAYLDDARGKLKDNPDRAEILSDLEQAIADKCGHYLRPHKNVVTEDEIAQVLKEMGSVQADEAGAAASPGNAAPEEPKPRAETDGAPRRLYQIREGAMISGICTGMAAYFNIDVTLVRIIFVVLAFLTGGLWILAYLAMMFVIPFAHTDEERAAASGAPFNAQEVIDRAKKHYAQFKDDVEWRRHWRQQRREWRRRWNDRAYWWAHNLQRNVYQFSARSGYFAQIVAGLMIPLLAIAGMVMFAVFIISLITLATTGTLFGWAVTSSIPLWAACLILCLAYGLLASPLGHARRAIYMTRSGFPPHWYAAWDSIFQLGALILLGWFCYAHIPLVHDFMQNFSANVASMWHNVISSFHHAGSSGAAPNSKIEWRWVIF